MANDYKKRIESIYELSDRIAKKINLMEVCGTHTMEFFKTGLRSQLPDNINLISGPGCPVCVTPNEYLDKAIAIAERPDTIITTFGDMVRVPGTYSSLEYSRASGADIRIVYSPLNALKTAADNPEKKVIFLGVGFETTTPAVAATIKKASKQRIDNFSVLCAHKTIPDAMSLLLEGGTGIDGFICPGHVSVIIGTEAYRKIASDYNTPCVITGFEAPDMAKGIAMLMRQIVSGCSEVENGYTRSVKQDGNVKAREIVSGIFKTADSRWRGIGVIPGSGLKIREEYSAFDADIVFKDIDVPKSHENPACRCGEVLKGACSPVECSLFGRKCTPENPVGPCMVSSEGTCSAYYKYSKKTVI